MVHACISDPDFLPRSKSTHPGTTQQCQQRPPGPSCCLPLPHWEPSTSTRGHGSAHKQQPACADRASSALKNARSCQSSSSTFSESFNFWARPSRPPTLLLLGDFCASSPAKRRPGGPKRSSPFLPSRDPPLGLTVLHVTRIVNTSSLHRVPRRLDGALAANTATSAAAIALCYALVAQHVPYSRTSSWITLPPIVTRTRREILLASLDLYNGASSDGCHLCFRPPAL